MQRQSAMGPDIPPRRRSEWSRLRRATSRPRTPWQVATSPVSTRPALPVTATQAAAIWESLTMRRREARVTDASMLARQADAALRGMGPYVDHGGALPETLVNLLGQLGIVIVPLAEAGGKTDESGIADTGVDRLDAIA